MHRLLASFALVLALVAPSAFAQQQHSATVVTVGPTLSFFDPGYVPNGSFNVTVTDGPACTGGTAGTFTINATSIAGSGPAGSTPPLTTVVTYIGFPAGNFLFSNAGAGQYTVTVTETGAGCDPPVNPVVLVVTVPNAFGQAAEPVPVDHPLALLMAGLALAGFALRRLRRR